MSDIETNENLNTDAGVTYPKSAEQGQPGQDQADATDNAATADVQPAGKGAAEETTAPSMQFSDTALPVTEQAYTPEQGGQGAVTMQQAGNVAGVPYPGIQAPTGVIPAQSGAAFSQVQNIPVLQCVNLQMKYGRKAALNGISFAVGRGRLLGLLGPNGSGKTTLIKLAAGLLVPTGGEILIAGTHPGVHTKEMVSYLPDRNFLNTDMSFKACCKLFKMFFEDFDEDRAMRMVQDLGINPRQRFKTLSKGNRDKVQLILTMSRRAMLYLLDEPIAGVDPATRDYILDTIVANRNPGSTVIISTHLIQDVEKVLDDVIFIKDGNIALYNSAEAVRQENGKSIDEVFREIYAYHSHMEGVM